MKPHLTVKSLSKNFYFALEWRVIATTITFIAAYLVSGSFTVSFEIAGIEIVLKIIAQVFWLQYRVGKK